MMTFENAMGAMHTPEYSKWSESPDPGGKEMIALIWFNWIAMFIFNVVILLNFLIAFIS